MKIRATDMSGRGKLLKKAANTRGAILNGVITIERWVDTFLSCYFCDSPKKRDEIMDLVFAPSGGMPFDPKKHLLAKVLKLHKPNNYNEYANYLKDIDKLQLHRNVLAHYLLEITEETITKHIETREISFLKFNPDSKPVVYTQELIDEIVIKIEECIKVTKELCRDFTRDH